MKTKTSEDPVDVSAARAGQRRVSKIAILCDVRWFNAVAWNAVGLAESLHALGHDVIFAARHDSPPGLEARRRGLELLDLHIEKAGPVRLARGIRTLTAVARERGIQVFDAHRSEGFLAALAAARRLGDGRAVIRTRADVRPPKGHLINRILHRRGPELISAAAHFMTAEYAAIGVSGERVRVIHPGVVLDHFVPGGSTEEAATLRERLTGSPTRPLIGVVGRLTAVKGHAVFIDAAAKVARQHPDAHFVISGEEWDVTRDELEERATARELGERLHFLDRLPDVRPLLEALDIVVVASTGSEAVSRIALEAMALARPVVATAVGSLPELLADDAGRLVTPDNPQALADACRALIADPDEAVRLGERGRRALERGFTRERAVRATIDLYEDASRRASGRVGAARVIR